MPSINKGYIFAVIAVFLYAISDAIGKCYVIDGCISNVMFIRTLARFFPFVVLALCQRINPYRTEHVWKNILRAICVSSVSYAFLAAYKYSPMTDVLVISQSAAIIVIPLSMIFLGEKFNPYTTVAIILGFFGIVCAFRPSGDVLQLGTIFALLVAILNATNKVLVKKLSFSDNELTMIFYHQTLLLMISLGYGFDFSISLRAVFPLIISGLISGLALFLTLRAYRFGECSYIASASYLILIPSTIIDCVIYDTPPDMYIIIGSVLIISGCIIANSQSRKP